MSSYSEGLKVTKKGIIFNSILILIKFGAGVFGHSFALISDAVHSVSDLLTDFILLAGLKIAGKPQDSTHRYGHGKVETYLAHLIGVIIIFVALGMGYTAGKSIYIHIEKPPPEPVALIAALIAVFIKEYLFRITFAVGKKLKSQSLIANAWEHRSDAFSSITAFIGISCTFFNKDWHIIDQYVALIISFFVLHVGVNIAWKSFKDIIDTSPSEDLYNRVREEVKKITGVIDVHNLRARYYSSSIFLDIHLTVNPDISVKEGHDIAENASKIIRDNFEEIIDTTIHVEPHEY